MVGSVRRVSLEGFQPRVVESVRKRIQIGGCIHTISVNSDAQCGHVKLPSLSQTPPQAWQNMRSLSMSWRSHEHKAMTAYKIAKCCTTKMLKSKSVESISAGIVTSHCLICGGDHSWLDDVGLYWTSKNREGPR